MMRALPDFAIQLADMENCLQGLKKLVSSGWTYAVIWKIGPDHRTPVWHQGCFDEGEAGALAGQARRFESIFRQCQFTPARPGYACLAWMRQSPFWWTRRMEPVLTDKKQSIVLSGSWYPDVGVLSSPNNSRWHGILCGACLYCAGKSFLDLARVDATLVNPGLFSEYFLKIDT